MTLLEAAAIKRRSTVADANGHFSFGSVAVVLFLPTIVARGMQPKTQQGTLNADELVELPAIAMLAAASDQVEVLSLTQQEIAEMQMKQEEKQRLVGLVPNFYVVYDWNAKPLTAKQNRLAVRSIIELGDVCDCGGVCGY